MIEFTNTIDIDRPISEVYDYLADLRHVPEWNWAIEETAQITPGPVAVGTRYRQTRHTPRRSVEHLQISALEPNRMISVTGDLGPFPARVTYSLHGNGSSTRVENRIGLHPTGPARIAGSLLGPSIAQSVADNLGVLKRRLESA